MRVNWVKISAPSSRFSLKRFWKIFKKHGGSEKFGLLEPPHMPTYVFDAGRQIAVHVARAFHFHALPFAFDADLPVAVHVARAFHFHVLIFLTIAPLTFRCRCFARSTGPFQHVVAWHCQARSLALSPIFSHPRWRSKVVIMSHKIPLHLLWGNWLKIQKQSWF